MKIEIGDTICLTDIYLYAYIIDISEEASISCAYFSKKNLNYVLAYTDNLSIADLSIEVISYEKFIEIYLDTIKSSGEDEFYYLNKSGIYVRKINDDFSEVIYSITGYAEIGHTTEKGVYSLSEDMSIKNLSKFSSLNNYKISKEDYLKKFDEIKKQYRDKLDSINYRISMLRSIPGISNIRLSK